MGISKRYTEDTNCGLIDILLGVRKSRHFIRIKMERFGDCEAYRFIGDHIALVLQSMENPSKLAKSLQTYECSKGDLGCIKVIGKCLEDYFS